MSPGFLVGYFFCAEKTISVQLIGEKSVCE